jgi:hypothetical protein
MSFQQPYMTLGHRLGNLFHSHTHGTKVILGEMALVLALGFGWNAITGAPSQENVAAMDRMLPTVMWALLWLLYCVLRLQSAVDDARSLFAKYSTALLGMWLWGCMLFAGLAMKVHDNTVYLYAGPMQIELWILLQTALWWTKYDPAVLKTVPGALESHPADDEDEERERPWAETKVFPHR